MPHPSEIKVRRSCVPIDYLTPTFCYLPCTNRYTTTRRNLNVLMVCDKCWGGAWKWGELGKIEWVLHRQVCSMRIQVCAYNNISVVSLYLLGQILILRVAASRFNSEIIHKWLYKFKTRTMNSLPPRWQRQKWRLLIDLFIQWLEW